MRNKALKLFLISSIIITDSLMKMAFAETPAGYLFLSYDEGQSQAKVQGKRIFLYFGRYGCGWCDKTNKETFSDNGLKILYSRNYILVYVDAESGNRLTLPSGERITELELGSRLNVFATPMFVYLENDGTVIFKAPAYQTVKDFTDLDKYIQGNHYKTKTLSQFLAENK